MSVVYFTDRDLGLQFPKILSDAGLAVERHRDHFRHDAADENWLAEIGRRGWVALTHNSRIRYTPNEKDAVIRHGVRLLVIIGSAPYPATRPARRRSRAGRHLRLTPRLTHTFRTGPR